MRRRAATAVLLPFLAVGPVAGAIRFRDVAAEWGVLFRHHHGGAGERYVVETIVGGVAVLDYDGDGDEDLFFVDGAPLPGYEGEETGSVLFRNDGGGFVDVTATAGLRSEAYGSGVAVADVDRDGTLDLYVTAFGPNLLYRNRGDGTFAEAGSVLGVDDPSFGSAAAFADHDLDGDLDLYVVNYVQFTLETHRPCVNSATGAEGYCRGTAYPSARDVLFRNDGATFTDVTEPSGLAGVLYAPGLGAVWADYDGDRYPDVFVANDGAPNFLFVNEGDGTYLDESLLSGTAFGESGKPEGGMGVAVGDLDENGRPDILVTNFEFETNALYANLGGRLFTDNRFAMGVAEPSLLWVGFGISLDDLDLDGDQDLLVANGHVLDNPEEHEAKAPFEQPNQALENLGRGRFREVADAGIDVVRSSRGLATGDLDGDGDVDFVVANSNDLAEAYENVSPEAGGWLAVDLQAADSAPDGVGATLRLRAGGREQARTVVAGTSYLSASSFTARFGLGGAAGVEELEVAWPRGSTQRFVALPGNRRLRVVESMAGAAR